MWVISNAVSILWQPAGSLNYLLQMLPQRILELTGQTRLAACITELLMVVNIPDKLKDIEDK